jgi:hypothetical protein
VEGILLLHTLKAPLTPSALSLERSAAYRAVSRTIAPEGGEHRETTPPPARRLIARMFCIDT